MINLNNFLSGKKSIIGFGLIFSILVIGLIPTSVNYAYAVPAEVLVSYDLAFVPDPATFGGIGAAFITAETTPTSAPAENTVIHLEGAPGLILDPVLTSSLCVEPYFPEPAPSTGFIVDCTIGLISPDDFATVVVVFELGPSGNSPSSFLELTTTNLENDIQYIDPQLLEFTCNNCPKPLTITLPADNTVTNDNTPNIHGTSQKSHDISLNVLGVGVNNTLTTTSTPGGTFQFNNISPALPDGIYTITATDIDALDASGNPLPVSDMITLIIDTITFMNFNPALDGSITGSTTPTIFGTAEPNSIVEVFIDGDSIGTTNSTTGNWSLLSSTLSDGPHTVTALVTDPAGNTASPTSITIIVDTSISIDITSHTNGQFISNNTPTFSGISEINSLVEVLVNGTSIGTTNSTTGNWSLPSPLLEDGLYFINATGTDGVGNSDSVLISIIVDTMTFVAFDPSLNNTSTNDKTPNIFGTAESNSEVEIFVDGIPIGTQTADDEDGTWDDNSPALSDGPHTFTAITTDVLGNTASAVPIIITIDSIMPTAIMTTLPGPFTNLNPIPFNATFSEPVFNSTGGSIIPIKILDGTLTPGSISTVDNIVFTFTVIPDGEGMVKAKIEQTKVFDAVGNSNLPSNYAIISYDETDPIPVISSSAAPTTNISPIPFTVTFNEFVSGLEESEINIFNGTITPGSLSTFNNKIFTFSVIPVADGIVNATIPAGAAQDQAGNDNILSNTQDVIYDTTIAITILSHVNGDVTNDNTPLFFGTSDPGANIEVTYDALGIFYAANVTDGSGIWQTVDESNPIPDGTHLITANATDAAGNTVSVSITIDTMPPMVVLTTTSPSPTNVSPLFFNATFSEIVTDLKEDEIIITGGTVDEDSLSPGDNDETLFYTFTVTPSGQGFVNATIPSGVAEDLATNLNTASNNLGVLYDSVTFVTITSPLSGSTTSDNTPTFSGNAEPGVLVKVFSGATLLGNTTASVTGAWSFTPGSALIDGTRTIKAESTDALGNQANTISIIVIDTIPPVIILNGTNPQNIPLLGPYVELGATTDDGSPVVINSTLIDVNTLGSYLVFYNSTDTVGNVASLVNRTVNVVDTQIPIITLLGDNPQTIELGDGYTELNATAFDVPDGDISGDIVIDISDFIDALGSYGITYDVVDSSANSAVQQVRTVDVVDTTAPVILLDSYAVTIELGGVYNPANANATDNDPAYVEDITVGGDPVDVNVAGVYFVSFTTNDPSGNIAVVNQVVTIEDTTKPVIALNGGTPITLESGVDIYTELGANVTDNDPVYSEGVIIGGDIVDANTVGVYVVTYDAPADAAGNIPLQITRTVNVVDTLPPVLTLLGDNPQFIELGAGYTELGATAIDTEDGDITGSILIDSSAFLDVIGSYDIIYNVTDSSGNSVQDIRNATVQDTVPPTFNVSGNATDYDTALVAGQPYTVGAVLDIFDLSLPTTTTILGDGAVDVNTPGVYLVTYTVEDSQGNSFTITETVTVSAGDAPVLTLLGDNPQFIELGAGYTELGATAIDTEDGDITGSILIDSSAFLDVIGSYDIIYNVTDSSGNSVQDIRNATVQDTVPPTFNVSGNATDYDTALVAGQPYTVGAVLDIFDLSLPTTTTILGDGAVDVNTPGVYLVTYTVEDSQGNSFTITETVTVSAGDAPVLTLLGDNPQFIELGAGYTELGATAIDTEDGDITGSILIDSSAFLDVIGSYDIIYNVTDSSGNSVQDIRNATVQDTVPPTFNVSGNATDYDTALVAGQPYTVGAVLDIFDLSLPTTTTILGDGAVDVNTPGVYLVTYTVEDSQGNSFTITETVTVSAGDAPVLTLLGDNPQFIELGAGYTELGATAIDTEDGDITGSILIDSSAFLDVIGSYDIIYNVTDSSGNSVQDIRNATVQDTVPPTFNVSGNATDYDTALVAGQPYTVGAVLDIFDLSLPTTTTILGDGAVDVNTPGVYLVTYTVEDSQGNSFTITETVTVSAGDAPVLTLLGDNPQFIELGAGYTELGATAIDTEDGDITGSILIDSSAFLDVIGSYDIIYNVTDSSGNSVQDIRNATVQDTVPPTFNVSGNATDYDTALVAGQPYTVGAVLDIFDLSLPTTTTILGDGAVDVNTPGVYLVTYTVEDSQGNSFTITETVTVSAGDAPVLTLLGDNPQFIELGAGYTELGATAIDTEDGDITGSILIDSSAFLDVIGSYDIIYNVTDSSGNSVQDIRNATVQDTVPPTFNVSGNATDYDTALVAGQPYTVGAVLDIFDLSLPTTTTILGDGAVDVNTPGVYLVTYTVEDSQGNSFTITETVTVSAGDAPVLTLLGDNPQFIELGAGYTELGATAIDTEDGDITGSILIDSSAFLDVIGSYDIIYNVTDSSGNSVQDIRNATVQDTVPPTFNVSGNATDYDTALVAGQPYTVGAVLDIFDLSLPTTTTILGDGAVDVNTPGVYLVTYTVEDSQGNSFTITETVTVSAGDAPVLTLLGDNPQFIELGAGYTELGATAIDTEDGDITGSILIDSSAFLDVIGSYDIIYNVTDSSGNSVQDIRNATVQDTVPPTFNVSGNATDYDTALVAGQPYTVGAVLDIFDLSLPTTTTILGDGAVDVNTPGVYLVTYTVEDSQGNSFTITETVTVSAGDAPVLTLLGDNPQFIELGAGYTELGATAIDTEDGDITGSILIDSSAFLDVIGSYDIIYNVTDSSGNSVQDIRNATVQDTVPPTFNVSGNATDYDTALVAGQPYTVGAVLDIFDLSLPTTTTILGDGAVDVNTPGVYLVTYTVEDSQGNSFTITETVTVSAGDAPVLTLLGDNPQFIELGAGYTELGATAIDTEDGDITGSILIDSSAFLDVIGSYDIIYNVTDSSGNSVQDIRNATVQDTVPPTFNVSGNATDYDTALVAGQPYTVGAVLDIFDLSLPTTTTILGDGAVDVNTPGVYLVTYTVEDSQGNSFTITETVTVSAGDAPVLTLLGDNPQFIELGAGYTELGATAIDTEDGDITGSILIDSSAFLDVIGSYDIIYNVTDSSGNSVQDIRNATVQDTVPPTFNVSGNATDYDTALVAGQPYTVGAVLDIFDLSLPTTTTILGDGAVDVNTPGVYLVTYTVEDSQGNSFTITETVTVSAGDAPVLTLLGDNPQFIELGAGYTELGATAIDTEDGDITGSILIDSSAFLDVIGSYDIIYNVTDSSGNSVQDIRNATVQDTVPPTFNVSGNATDYDTALVAGQPYTVGAVLDIFDLSLPTTTTILGDGAVDVNTPGVYLVTYTVEDSQGNSFTITETVTVSAGDAPVLTLLGDNPQFIELGAGYTELGATAIDTEDGDITGSILIDSSAFLDVIGSYDIIYNVTDSSGNSVQDIRNATVQDTVPPTFNVSGNATDYDTALVAGQPYTVGAVLDIFDLSLPTTTTILGDGAVDVNTPGVYLVTYTVEDSQGNSFTITETVTVSAGDAPVLTLLGDNPQFIELGAGYTELGATAIDTEDGDITGSILIDSSAFLDVIGSYDIIYNVTDSSGNSVQDIRNATVQDTVPPTFNVSGNATDYDTALVAGQPYTVGAVLDIFDLSLPTTTTILGDGAVDVNTPGVYLVTYTVEDSQGNSFTITETVTVLVNTSPILDVIEPISPFTETEGVSILFNATAIDTEDGDLTSDITWTSDLDGLLHTGGSFTTTGLTVGIHTITVSVTDSFGNITTEDITVTIEALVDASPILDVIEPISPFTETEGVSILFNATAIDTEDGDLTSDITWTSDLDGLLHTGGSFTTTGLTVGIHTITVSVTDSFGNITTEDITVTIEALVDASPILDVIEPISPFTETEGVSILFNATAIDTEDGDLTSDITWTSDLDGLLHTGGSFTTTGLTVGIHTITVSVTDSFGNITTEDITVTIEALVDASPILDVIEPISPFTETEGVSILFNATAIDTEDGDLTSDITWTSDLDGLLHTGGSFTTTGLTVGIHTITVSVTDSFGNITTEDITVTIEEGVVLSVQAQKLAIIDELKDLKPLAESSKTVKDIDQAIKRVQKSLDSKYWEDENTLAPKQGHHSIHEEEKAVKKLMEITYKQNESESFLNSIQDIIDHITLIDKTFAEVAIEEAEAANTNGQFTKQIEKAIEQFEKGLEDEQDGKFDKAIHHYEKAWVITSIINLLDDLDDYVNDDKDEDKDDDKDDKKDKVDEDKDENKDEDKDDDKDDKKDKVDEDKEEKDDDKEDKVDEDKKDKSKDDNKEEKDDDSSVNNAPVISLLGANPQIIQLDDSYLEFNATATDIEDGDITGSIVINSTSVNTAVLGNYTVTYDVSDSLLLPAVQQTRTVEVVNGTIDDEETDDNKEEKDDDSSVNNAPVISLLGANPQIIQLDDSYLEFNATATDIEDGDITGSIVINSTSVNTAVLGNYTVTYDVSDSLLLPAVQQTRTVEVVNGTIDDEETDDKVDEDKDEDKEDKKDKSKDDDKDDKVEDEKKDKDEDKEDKKDKSKDDDKDDKVEDEKKDKDEDKEDKKDKSKDDDKDDKVEDEKKDKDEDKEDKKDKSKDDDKDDKVEDEKKDKDEDKEDKKDKSKDDDKDDKVEDEKKDKDEDKEDKKDKSKDDDKDDKVEDEKKDKDEDKEDKKDKSKDDDKDDKVEDEKKDKDEDKEDKKDKSKDDDKDDKVEDEKKDKDEDKEDKKDKSKDDDKDDKVEDEKKDKDEDKEDKKNKDD